MASTSKPEDIVNGSSPGSFAHQSGSSSSPLEEKRLSELPSAEPSARRPPIYARPIFWIVAVIAFIIVAAAVLIPVGLVVIKPRLDHSSNRNGLTTGGNGSVVALSDGTTFTYVNNFGGYWVYDPEDPFNNDARPNSWTPPLNTSWDWGKDKIYGVNLGGLFALEPFVTPAFFQKYPSAVDEWTLSILMANDTASGGLGQLEDHYRTFITEQDIAEIAAAGLNWIRLPIPFWAIEKWDFEPFLEKVCWPYILRVLQWARKYGIRINLTLQTVPGSQSGYFHSGKMGSINFLNGVMGLANAERTLNYIRIITEFISQPEWQPVVPVFSIVNEVVQDTIGTEQMTTFYLAVHDMIRNITGIGEGHGPYIAIHDGFQSLESWAGFLGGSDRIMLDTHAFVAFNNDSFTSPIATGTGLQAGGEWPRTACNSWADSINASQTAFGVTVAGEFFSGYNLCGLFVPGTIGNGSIGPECSLFIDSSQWNQTVKDGFLELTLASMDALQNWFYWTWKIGKSSTTNTVEAPLLSYQLGMQGGWVPTDPRVASGTCAALGVSPQPFDGEYKSWQTGGAGAGMIDPTSRAAYGQYPPASINGLTSGANQALLPTYTSTAPVPTLPPPTFIPIPTVSVGNGWYDPADTGLAPTEVKGCSYPNAWDAVSSPVPTALCPPATAGPGTGTMQMPAPAQTAL